MSNYNFETVDVPQGSYISWGPKPGQIVTGKVLSFDISGGTDFNGNPCPVLSLELIDACVSINKSGEEYTFDAGDVATINAGQASLRRAILAADLHQGDIVRITFAGLEKTSNGTVKVFEVAVARGGAQAAPKPKQPHSADFGPATRKAGRQAPPF